MQPKWQRREKKLEKRKTGMRVSGRSVFTLQSILKRKAEEAARPVKRKAKRKSTKPKAKTKSKTKKRS